MGAGYRNQEGKFIAPAVKEGDRVLLPEYGGTTVKLADKVSELILADWIGIDFETTLLAGVPHFP